ncbi:hypothetical protein PanWU01x14_014370 [Parasponia andersonii]|uniref:Uncharacterized protein n=1 Tax=Parasponia andersonii TaxID=3476 RepID=A0A2P5E0A5_PARAD|nr:hypothetical protein PanWU01x14_014370 [Parasponia andersonii]
MEVTHMYAPHGRIHKGKCTLQGAHRNGTYMHSAMRTAETRTSDNQMLRRAFGQGCKNCRMPWHQPWNLAKKNGEHNPLNVATTN